MLKTFSDKAGLELSAKGKPKNFNDVLKLYGVIQKVHSLRRGEERRGSLKSEHQRTTSTTNVVKLV